MIADLAGVGALLALVALPGLLLVRAPLVSVPSLSLAFWTLSFWWTPAAVGRERFLIAVLAGSGILALLRLRELVPWPLLSKPALVVSALAFLHLWPFFLARPPRGSEMSFHALAARVVVWNDARPQSLAPLASVRPFGAHAPALASLGADVSFLSGIPADRGVALVALAGEGLLLLGLFAAYAHRMSSAGAAACAFLGLAIVRLPEVLAPFGEGAPMLALALACGASAIRAQSSSGQAAVATGFVMGAGIVAHDLVGLIALGGVLWLWRTGRRQGLLTLAAALLAAVPQLRRLAAALSRAELGDMALASPWTSHLPWIGALIALAALAAAAERLRAAPRPAQIVALGATAALGIGLECHRGSGIAGPPAAVLEWAMRQDPTAIICTAPDTPGIWIPALAGRAVSAPHLPPVYREEGDRERAPCLLTSFHTLR